MDEIDRYLENNQLSEDEIGIIFELNLSEGGPYVLEYTLVPKPDHTSEKIIKEEYDNIGDAWENFLSQLADVTHSYGDADLRLGYPESYEGPAGGGNPGIRVVDKAREDFEDT